MTNIPWVYVAYFFGGTLVTLYSLSAFNAPEYTFEDKTEDEGCYGVLAKPSLPRYMTEKFRYRTYSLLFVLIALTEYFLLARLLPIIPGIDLLFEIKDADPKVINAAMAFSSALLLIGAVNFIKWPRKVLFDFVKGWLHDFASIPEMGRSVFEALCYEPIDYTSREAQAHIDSLLAKRSSEEPRQDLQEADFKGGNPMSITWKWARLSYAVDVIEKWREDNPLFAIHLQESSLGWARLSHSYTETIDEIIRYRNNQLNEDQKITLNKKIELLLANCHRLMSCLIIMAMKPGEDPFVYIRNQGYRVIPGNRFSVRGGEVARIIVAIISAITVIALASLLLPTHGSADQTVKRIMVYILSGLIILALPIFIVLTAKRFMTLKGSWQPVTKEAPYTSFFEMPLPLYSGLSLFSFAVSTVLMMLSLWPDRLQDLSRWKIIAVFCFISAITAFFTAYRTDIPPKVFPTRSAYYFSRAKGAGLQGILTAATVWLGLILIPHDFGIFLMLKFTAMGFAVAVAVHLTMFYSKHHFERRKSPRIFLPQPAVALIGDMEVPASFINRSTGGASLKVNKKYWLPKGSDVELITQSQDHLFGLVERSGNGEMHIRFIQQPFADTSPA